MGIMKRMERAGHTTYTANRQGFIEKNGAGIATPHTPPIVKVLLKRMERAGHTTYTANRQGFIEKNGAGGP